MNCPAVAPDTDLSCTLDDDEASHSHGHIAPTPDGQGRVAWGVTLDDHERWGTEPPQQLQDWVADAEQAARDAETAALAAEQEQAEESVEPLADEPAGTE